MFFPLYSGPCSSLACLANLPTGLYIFNCSGHFKRVYGNDDDACWIVKMLQYYYLVVNILCFDDRLAGICTVRSVSMSCRKMALIWLMIL